MSYTHTAPAQFNDIVCNSTRNLDGLVFFGDPHGQFEKLEYEFGFSAGALLFISNPELVFDSP